MDIVLIFFFKKVIMCNGVDTKTNIVHYIKIFSFYITVL